MGHVWALRAVDGIPASGNDGWTDRIPGIAKSPLLLVIFAMVREALGAVLLSCCTLGRVSVGSSGLRVPTCGGWSSSLGFLICHPEGARTAYDVDTALELVIRQKVKVDVCMCCFSFKTVDALEIVK